MRVVSGPRILLSRKQIKQAIAELAAQVRKDYQGKELVLIGILKGSFVFMADLMRELDIPVEVDFVKASSYGSGKQSSGKVHIVHGLKTPIKSKDVLLVEDIVDTGLTISVIMDYLRKRNPASLKLCALTDKPSRRKIPVTIDYLGFTVPDKFIVGYGIDCDEKYRELCDICCLD